MRKQNTMFVPLAMFFTFFTSSVLAAVPWESFEGTKNKWVMADWKTSTKEVTVVTQNASDGKSALKVAFAGINGKNEAVASCESAKGDWTKYTTLQFDVFSEAKGTLELSTALSTGPKWEWFESKPVQLKAGWNRGIKITLNGQDFKSEASGWKHAVKIGNLKDMQRLSFKLLAPGGEETGAIYLDNIVLK
jgi:hypothetical protein